MSKSKAIVFTGINEVVIENYDVPALRPDEIRVATEYSGVSQGTEIWALTGKRPELTYPTVPGYQSVGVIEEVGAQASGYRVGQRVLFNTSRLPDQFPATWMGGHVSRAIVPVRPDGHPVVLPASADPASASLAYLPAVSLRGIRMIDIAIGDLVVVTGQGLIGQASAQLARLRGAIVITTDLSVSRRRLSKQCSADIVVNPAEQNLGEVVRSIKPAGADAVIETTGRADQVAPCIDLLRWEGQLLLQGYYPQPINFDFHVTHMKKPRIAVTCGCDAADAGICLRLMNHGKMNFRDLITDVVAVSEARDIYAKLARGDERMLGVVFDWGKKIMKALIVSKPNEMQIADIAPPAIGAYDALIKIEACGICNSTDAKLIDGTMFWAPPFPFVLGHESVGVVVEVGNKVKHFRVGDRVTRPLAFWPGSRSDLNVAMGGFAEMGIVRDGRAMAADGDASLKDDYNVQRQLVLPADMDPVHGALAISLAETASVLNDLPPIRGKTVVIAGTGVAGLAMMLWCKLAGATVIAIGRRESRLQLARDRGADAVINSTANDWPTALQRAAAKSHAGGEIDCAIDATGDVKLATELLRIIKPGRTTVAYGVPPTGDAYPARWRNAVVEEHHCLPWVVDLLHRGWIKPEWFITHQWPLDQAINAFEQVSTGDVLKGFIRMR